MTASHRKSLGTMHWTATASLLLAAALLASQADLVDLLPDPNEGVGPPQRLYVPGDEQPAPKYPAQVVAWNQNVTVEEAPQDPAAPVTPVEPAPTRPPPPPPTPAIPQLPAADLPPPPSHLPAPTQTPRDETVIPLNDPAIRDRIQFSRQNDLVSLTVRDAPLAAVLGLIAEQHGLNIVTGEDVNQRITVTLTNVSLSDALDAILTVNGFTWSTQRNILIVSRVDATNKPAPTLQGRTLQVFNLDYVSSVDVDKIVKGLLSPVGQSFTVQTSPMDQRRTQEQVIVEDLPQYVERVSQYIAEVDRPPRQVVVEAHVLQITLSDNCRHGVNFEQIMRIANAEVALQTTGFASALNPPAALLRVDGTDLNAIVEAINSTTDSKTLASPKVTVLNGQEARMQIGGQLGYLTTTTTQTSSLQSVNFLSVGVILQVTPIITVDGQVLMTVKPQISTGRINSTTSLPESETTEVETRVMLADGEAIIIGGLIKEVDTEIQNKIPHLGDVPYLGRLFQRRSIERSRNEIVIMISPRIVPDMAGCRERNVAQVEQVMTPLFVGPLERVDRTSWEPLLKDAHRMPGAPPPSSPYFNARPTGSFQAVPPLGLDELPLPRPPSPASRGDVRQMNYAAPQSADAPSRRLPPVE